MPRSRASLVIKHRPVLEESLRQAVLVSGDAEALLLLAERLGNDLELWEAALKTLPESDLRRAPAPAQVKGSREDRGI